MNVTYVDNPDRQMKMETHLEKIWERGIAENAPLQVLFGPFENWLLTLGEVTLLLHPVLKEWYFLDRIHDAWEKTGFGVGEKVFVAEGPFLGVREPDELEELEAPTQAMSLWQLAVTRGEMLGFSFPISNDFSIGRGEKNDLNLRDKKISRKHAMLEWNGEVYEITDLDSSNGTYVNSVRINAPVELKPGDNVMVGETVLVLFKMFYED